jgi:hypothetical protein
MNQISGVPRLAMDNKTSIRNFVTLMTGSAGLSRDAGTLTRKAGSLSRDPAALGGNGGRFFCYLNCRLLNFQFNYSHAERRKAYRSQSHSRFG